jgi:hypothetical protein
VLHLSPNPGTLVENRLRPPHFEWVVAQVHDSTGRDDKGRGVALVGIVSGMGRNNRSLIRRGLAISRERLKELEQKLEANIR